jgi:hypothetical protein
MTQAQIYLLIAKRRQGQLNLNVYKSKPIQPKRQVNAHDVADTVNIDDIIDYTVDTHGISMIDDDATASVSMDTLLAHTAGCSASLGESRHVLDATQKSDKGKNQNLNAGKSEPGTLKLGNATYFLNRRETITII